MNKNPIKHAKIISENTPIDDYLAFGNEFRRGDRQFVMSNSELKRFASCPSRWIHGQPKAESEALSWGSLVDCLATDEQSFADRYAVKPLEYRNEKGETKPWNGNATVCKEWVFNQTKAIVTAKEVREARLAVARLHEDARIHYLFENSRKQVFVSATYADEETGISVPIKCLIDLAPVADLDSILADLKTCNHGGIGSWTKQVFQFGYHIQAALYLDCWNVACDEERTNFLHVVQESEPPYEPGRRLLSDDFIELGRQQYLDALKLYCRCLQSQIWPGFDDHGKAIRGWTLIEPQAWMISADYRQMICEPEETINQKTESEDIVP